MALDFTGALRTTPWGLLLQRAPSRCCVSFAHLCMSLVPLASKVPTSPSAGSLPSAIPFAAHGTSSHMLRGLALCPCDEDAMTFLLVLLLEDKVLCTLE